MGPRLFSRGKYNKATLIVIPDGELQWGRGFSAAESEYGVVWGRRKSSASMGPRLFSRGKNQGNRYNIVPTAASMGPRLFSRGKCRWARSCIATLVASMGPRLFSRGKVHRLKRAHIGSPASMGPRLFSRGKPLLRRPGQGRPVCFNGAAAFQPRKAIWYREVHDNGMSGFNGAAAFQPRKAVPGGYAG